MDETGFPMERYDINTAEYLTSLPRVIQADVMGTCCKDGS